MKKRSVFLGLCALLGGFLLAPSVSAVTFQNNVDVEFTFNSTLSISLSSADLLIANLAPGASASSNTITVSVNTNNITGYTLSAKVGDGTTYTNDKLVNSSSNTYFDNLTSSSTLANFGNNKWGYALGTISSSSTYSGLVYNTDTIINATTNASGTAATGYTGTSNTSFTIAAKASDTQASGDYKNVIIFTVVGNAVPEPPLIMQEVASWKNDLDIGDEIQAMDLRDNKVYYVAKLADGNIWMTQNLDHDIDSSYNYNSTNTDVPVGWNDTLSDTRVTSNTTWPYSYTTPDSYDPGDYCWNGVTTYYSSQDYSNLVEACSQFGNRYHLGNYYNWTSAVAMENSSSYVTDNTDVNQSICPAGWMLPKNGGLLTGSGSFIYLITAYGWEENGVEGGYSSSWAEPLLPYMALSGGYSGYEPNNVAYMDILWSSVVEDEDYAYYGAFFYDGGTTPQASYGRGSGSSIRCVAR